MQITKVTYSISCVKQLVYHYNQKYNIKIKYQITYQGDMPFTEYTFEDTIPKEIIFEFAYDMGASQNYLSEAGLPWLPLKEYPIPEDE